MTPVTHLSLANLSMTPVTHLPLTNLSYDTCHSPAFHLQLTCCSAATHLFFSCHDIHRHDRQYSSVHRHWSWYLSQWDSIKQTLQFMV